MNQVNNNVVPERELKETSKNLFGICKAVVQYGMPLNRKVRAHVRGKLDILTAAAWNQSDEASPSREMAKGILANLLPRYQLCDPVIAGELQADLGRLSST